MEQTYYSAETQLLYSQLKLGRNAKALLRAYDDFKFRRLDQSGLGRMVRLSSNNRRAIADTIKQVAEIMAAKPEQVKHCLEIIKSCTEILKIADAPVPSPSFPFTKIPVELRQKVYSHFLANMMHPGTVGIVARPEEKKCQCVNIVPSIYTYLRNIDVSLAMTSKQIRDEFLVYLYRKYAIYFTCGCQLRTTLGQNSLLQQNIISAKVHWCGPSSHQAFTLLANCRQLRELEVVISRATLNHLTPREIEMRKYFTSHKPPRICDALGADQLFAIKGMQSVWVSHVNSRQAMRRTEDDRANLTAILAEKLCQPRDGEGAPGY